MGQARLREALQAGGPGTQKEKGPPVADGILTVTPDTPEALEWKSRRSAIDSAGTSSSFLEDEDEPQPHSLYGKFTWKIENFSEISKRELRSTVFEVGSYKWYILVYPQGCDVCNHLSLFLCVADYDKLLPGWSHFAQFTIAVVNKDPKKSKYSDTLHRFCKKEHDWGWKKFMELSKVLEGFTVANTLVIKAQVQVIRDRPSLPFRCLDPQYRRELVRVYLTNVEGICRRFVDEKRESLLRIRETAASFKAYWISQSASDRKTLVQHKGSDMLKGLVKRFFNEKEVTSTLVMDALFSGCKQVEEATRAAAASKGKRRGPSPPVTINADRNIYALGQDVLPVLERACQESIPVLRDEKPVDALTVRHGPETDDYNRDFIERDEKRLADLGRRTVEMYVIAHIIAELEEHHVKFEKYKMQDALILAEEEGQRLDKDKAAAKAVADREKKQRKKEKRKLKEEADLARREAEEAERQRVEEFKRSQEDAQQAEHRREQQAAAKAQSVQATGVKAAQAGSTAGAQPLTVGRAMQASKEAAAQAAAKGLPSPSGPDPADGPSSSSSTSSKARTGSLAGASGRAQETFASASSSLNDLAAADTSEAAPRASGDSEDEDLSCNGDDTDSQPLEDSGQICTLHAQVNSLKDQVTALTRKLDSHETALEAAYEQIAVRDGRVRALEVQLRQAEEERSDMASALTAREDQLRQKDHELADKDAELSTLRASVRQQAQHAQQAQQAQPPQQQQQQQQQHRLQRVGSVASTTHSPAALEESSARSTASSESQPLSPTTSSVDPFTDALANGTHSRNPPQSHLPQDNGTSSQMQRSDASADTLYKPAPDKGRAGLDHRPLPRDTGVAGPSATDSQSRAPGRGQSIRQQAQPGTSDHSTEAVLAANAAAAAALRPRGSAGRPGSVAANHPSQVKAQHGMVAGTHANMPNGIAAKAQTLKGSIVRGLNGNAPSFIPASVVGLPTSSSASSLAPGNGGALNGHSSHVSYRNAAAGVSAPSAPLLDRGPSSQGSMSPRQSVSSLLHEPEASTPTSPAMTSNSLSNGDTAYSRVKGQPSPFRLTSPEGAKGSGAPTDASDLEDFAHMGMINDVLAS